MLWVQSASIVMLTFLHIDLGGDIGQWNPFINKTKMQIEELLVAAFGCQRKEQMLDFYRLDDRKAARLFAKFIFEAGFSTYSLQELASQFFTERSEIIESARMFRSNLEEIISLPVINVRMG